MPIYKNKDKPGYRVEVNYTDSFGNHKKIVKQNKDTLTLKDAKKVEAVLLMETNVYTGNNTTDATLDELYKFYCSVKGGEVKESTTDQNEGRYKNHISPYFKNKKLKKITMLDCQNWKNEINKKNYSLKYKNHLYTLFSSILNIGVKYEYISTNNLAKVGRFKDSNYIKRKIDFWTKEEFDKFISVVRKRCEEASKVKDDNEFILWGYYVMFNIMFWCGCRKGEVYPLQWKDLDLNLKMLYITKGLVKSKNEKSYSITAPKTKSSIRDIPMSNQLVEILKEQKQRYSVVYGFDEEFYICGGVKPLASTTYDEFKKSCIKEAGVKTIRTHDFRHSHASLLINSGVNIMVVKERLGHSSLKETLDTYAHLYESVVNEAIELLNKI